MHGLSLRFAFWRGLATDQALKEQEWSQAIIAGLPVGAICFVLLLLFSAGETLQIHFHNAQLVFGVFYGTT